MQTQTQPLLVRDLKTNPSTSTQSNSVIDWSCVEEDFLVGIRPSETSPHDKLKPNCISMLLIDVMSLEVNGLFLERLSAACPMGVPIQSRLEYTAGHFLYFFDRFNYQPEVVEVIKEICETYENK